MDPTPFFGLPYRVGDVLLGVIFDICARVPKSQRRGHLEE